MALVSESLTDPSVTSGSEEVEGRTYTAEMTSRMEFTPPQLIDPPAFAPFATLTDVTYIYYRQATITNDAPTLEDALSSINIVPNPYYAFSGYETSRLDNRVKFINLPQRCTISIYNVGGTLVRKFRKDNDLTYLDWDLKNSANIPIAGGVYICHVEVPDVGEKVLRWFGAMRPIDLQNF